MSEKPKPVKKKDHTSTARGVGESVSSKAPQPKPKAAFYVHASPRMVLVSDRKPAGAAGAQQFATFEEAKQAAIELLVLAIEEAEEQLLAIKRAERYDQLPGAGDAR
jgi:hypothetical protein